jgi:rhomboid protease GluP
MNPEQPGSSQSQPAPQQVGVSVPQTKPIVTYVLLGFTVLLFGIQLVSELLFGIDWLFVLGGKINELILAGQVWRLITPAFLHSNLMHIAFNMYALFILGRRIESTYGHGRFLLLYLLSALGGNVLSFVLSDANSLGASTAIFGLLAAEAVFILQNRRLFGQRVRGMLFNIAFILLINLMFGFSANTNIDNFGHLGGLLGGFIFSSLAGPKWILEGLPPNVSIKDVRTRKDVLLATALVVIGFIAMGSIRFLNH